MKLKIKNTTSKVLKSGEVSRVKPVQIKKKEVVQETSKFTDLRQVMDYNRPLTIFFSGVEYESYLDILYDLGVRNFLMSYEYLKGKGHSQLKKYPDMHIFIDSGAYTYMNDPKYEDYTIQQWEDQIEKYLIWAEKHKNQIFSICDLDLQYIVGCDKVYEWRKKYFEPFMLRTGIPVCFMYHDEGLEHWEYMCKRYPYVGLSLAIDNKENGYQELVDMFRIAEKHNALCQGMASTKTSMLTEFPFYTVDSTTWNVGLKYGEVSAWNETKMSRIKKNEFETKLFPIISRYEVKFDTQLIIDEDKTELIRVNAYAFVQAEKFVRDRLKSKMYWLKARARKVDINNLPDDFFPPYEWFEGACTDLKDYAVKMNINPDYESARDIILDMSTLLNWDNPDYEQSREEYLSNDAEIINSLHDALINRIVPNVETKVEDLVKFYKECLSGNNDKLLQLGTNFDRMIKERDSYIEDNEEELVDLDESELRVKLYGLLPTSEDVEEGAPEISSLDAEIFAKADIVPVFDDKGHFVKGQQSVRKPKKVYSSKYPKFACDTCYAAAKCPEFKAGFVCAYHKMFDRFDTRSMPDIIQSIQGIVEHNMTRMQRAMLMEVMNGTVDPVVSQLMDTNIKYMSMLKQMYDNGSAEVLRQTKIVRADGTQEETTQLTNPKSGGIMERLFAGLAKDTDEGGEQKSSKKNSRYEVVDEDA